MSRHHPGARRQPHKPEVQDDAFIAGVLDASSWAKRHQQMLIVLAVAVTVTVAMGLYWVSYRRSVRTQAINQLESIQQTIGLAAVEDAKQQLQAFIARFGSTSQADEAVLLLARLNLETGNAPVAINVLETASLSLRTPIGLQAASLLARAYEDQGRWEDAENLFLDVAAKADLQFARLEALEAAARARFRQRDLTGAAELYQEILDDLEETDPSRGIYELRLAEMNALAS